MAARSSADLKDIGELSADAKAGIRFEATHCAAIFCIASSSSSVFRLPSRIP
jgi:hypothetical protein